MGFFKDFKDDFSQAVNELVPGEDSIGTEDELLVDTLEGEPDMEAELSKLDGLLEQVSRQEERKEAEKKRIRKRRQRRKMTCQISLLQRRSRRRQRLSGV